MPKAPLFTDDETKLIRRSVSRVWDDCAYDCLQATADEKGKDINSVTISRAQVIEIALDAGRPEEYMRRDKLFTPDLKARWEALSYAQRIKMVRPMFSYDRYGV